MLGEPGIFSIICGFRSATKDGQGFGPRSFVSKSKNWIWLGLQFSKFGQLWRPFLFYF
jgi:hypothetical protein